MSVDIAQLRKYVEMYQGCDYIEDMSAEIWETFNALPELLDELEALRKKSTGVDNMLDVMPNTQPKATYPIKARVQGVDDITPHYRSSMEWDF